MPDFGQSSSFRPHGQSSSFLVGGPRAPSQARGRTLSRKRRSPSRVPRVPRQTEGLLFKYTPAILSRRPYSDIPLLAWVICLPIILLGIVAMIHTGYGRFVIRYVKYEKLLAESHWKRKSAELPLFSILTTRQKTTSTSRFFGTSTSHTLPLPPDTSSGPERYGSDTLAAFTEFASIAEDLNQVVQTLLLTNDSYVAPEIIRPLEDMGEELGFHALNMVELFRGRYDPQFNGDLGEYLHGLESPGQRFTSVDHPSLIERFCEKWVRVLDAISYTLEGDDILHYEREGGLWNPGSFTDEPEVPSSVVEKALYYIAPPSHHSPFEILFRNLELWLQDLVDDAVMIQNEAERVTDRLNEVFEGIIADKSTPDHIGLGNCISKFRNLPLHPGARLTHQMQISFSAAFSTARRASKKLSNVRSMVEAIRGSNPGNGAGPYHIPTREQLVVPAQAAATVIGQLREGLKTEWTHWKISTQAERVRSLRSETCKESPKLPECYTW